MPRQLVTKDSTQTLVSYAHVRPDESFVLTRPSAVAVVVTTPAEPTGTSGAATLDAVLNGVATTADAEEGDTTLTVATSKAQVRGRRVVITTVTGEQFTVRLSRSVTSATIYLASPLPMDVDTGATFTELRVSRALSLDETAQEGPGTVTWTATIGGQPYVWTEEFEIVRRVPRWEADTDEIERRFPEILALRERNDLALDETRDAALEEELLPRLRAKGIREANIVSTWPLVPPLVAAMRLFLSINDKSDPASRREELRAELEQKLALALQDVDGWYDAPQTEAPDVDQARADFSTLRWTR